jgi:uncharacterized protein
MIEAPQRNYPTISQSCGIVGVGILCMIVFIPIDLLLIGIVGEEISFLIYYVASMGATFWFAHRKRKEKGVNGYRFDGGSSLRTIALVSIATIAIQAGIFCPLVSAVPMPDFMKDIFLEFAKQNGVFSFIAIVVAAPVLEELLFRGIILDGLLRIYSPLKSIAFSSILFGVVHLNPWQGITAMIFGFFSGWLYYKTKRLTLSIISHAVNNLVAFGTMYFMDADSMMNTSLIDFYGGFMSFFMITSGIIALAVICLYLLRLDFKNMEINFGRPEQYI